MIEDFGIEDRKSGAAKKTRRGRGRPRLSDAELRKTTIASRHTDAEIARIDASRGRITRGEYVHVYVHNGPPPLPTSEINLDALKILSRVAGNLATLASAMRGGEYVAIEQCRNAVTELRNACVSAIPRES